MNILKLILIINMMVFLSGCRKQYTHEYLLTHPNTVESELKKCRQDTDYSAYCDQVKQTSDEFSALVNVRNENPEAFGQQVLQAEIEMSAAKSALNEAKENYRVAFLDHSSDLKNLQQQVVLTERDYQVKSQKTQVLLAVVAAMSDL